MAKAKMRYKSGGGFYVGIPARDLSAEEVERYGREFLLSLGLYEEVDPPKPRRAKEPEPEPEPEQEPEIKPFEAEIEED